MEQSLRVLELAVEVLAITLSTIRTTKWLRRVMLVIAIVAVTASNSLFVSAVIIIGMFAVVAGKVILTEYSIEIETH